MTGSGRLRVLAVSGLVAVVVLLAGARAWATVRKVEAGCQRAAAVAAAQRTGGLAGESGASWRGRVLRAAGCQAWREIRSHRQHPHHRVRVSDTEVPSGRRPLG